MYKKIIILSISLYFVFANTYTGKVIDSKTSIPIIDANIVLNDYKGIGTTTNESGVFSITVDTSGEINILVTAIGYVPEEKNIEKTNSDIITIRLNRSNVELSPIDVLAERSSLIGSGQNYYRIPGALALISKAEVLEFSDTDINRVVAQVPGVYTQEEDGYGLRPNIGMRGSGLERCSKINLMEDGVLIAPAPYSSPAAYYSPTAGRMESFEIRKGSSQIKYGPHSTGGAINYVSASIPQHLDFNGAVTLGGYGAKIAKFKTGMSSDNYGLLFQTYLDNAAGFKQIDGGGNTGYDKKDFLFKARVNTDSDLAVMEMKISKTEELSHETYLGLTREDFEDNPYRRYSASKNDQMKADHEQITVTGVIKVLSNLDITSTLYNNDFHRNWYKLNKVSGLSIGSILKQGEGTAEAYELLSAVNTIDNIFDIKANNRIYNSKGLQTVLRSDFTISRSKHNVILGFRQHLDEMDRYQWSDLYKMSEGELVITTPGIKGDGSKNNRLYSARANSIFFEDEIDINRFSLTAGTRFESISLERKDWGKDLDRDSSASSIKTANLNVLIPGLGLSYQLADGLNIFAGIHSGFSPPGPGIDDEDDVLPEESLNLEIGSRFNRGFHSTELVAFYNDYKNLLGEDTEATGSGTYAQFNGGKVLIQGLELSYSNVIQFNDLLVPLSLGYTFTNAKFKNSFDSEFEPWGNVSMDDELPYIPKNMMYAKVGFEKGKLKSYLRFKHTDRSRTFAGQDVLKNSNSTDELNILDFVGKYQLNNNFSLEFKLYNISNSSSIVASRPAGYRPNMPRQFMTSINFDF